MQHDLDEAAPGGWPGFLAGFLGDLLWKAGQIGQAVLDGVTVLLVALLIYHQGAVLHAVPVGEHPVALPSAAPPVTCAPDLGAEGACILAQVLKPTVL